MSRLSLAEALARLDARLGARPVTLRLSPVAALGHVLAEPLIAPASLPRFDASAMDGYAIGEGEGPVWRLVQTILAGARDIAPIGPGEAARIMTGARIPPGAVRVVMQEQARLEGAEVHLLRLPGDKPHIRRKGEDVAEGARLLEAGHVIGPGELALLVALGVQELVVRPRPRVALLSTGDELADSGARLAEGQIHDSNRPMLKAMLERDGAEVSDLGRLPDDPGLIRQTLIAAAAQHDLILTSGGAASGLADHLGEVLRAHGELEFWRLAMRPGKPLGFGRLEGCPLLILPGNPFAAAVGYALFARRALGRLAGREAVPDRLLLPLASPVTTLEGRSKVLAARVTQLEGKSHALPLERQGSASLVALAASDVLIILGPENTEWQIGDLVEVAPLWS